jgi:hypothetical protein
MFGNLSTKPENQTPSQMSNLTPTLKLPPALAASTMSPALAKPAPTRQTSIPSKPVINEMAAWTANEFFIGGIPETEPPMEVR